MAKNKTSKKSKTNKKASNIATWLERETPHKQTALENASRHFDDKDALTVNTLEAIYGQESSFGRNRRTRGIAGAAGDFQLERPTAKRMGLTVGRKNDERQGRRETARHRVKSSTPDGRARCRPWLEESNAT